MYAAVKGAVMLGMTPQFIQVEADLSDGLPGLQLIGDLSAEVRESGYRIRTALQNSGVSLPPRKIVINLAPADIHKRGATFDLPIAVAIAAITQKIPSNCFENCLILGEVGLDGSINPVAGVLPIVAQAYKSGYSPILLPKKNEKEAKLIPGAEVYGFSHLREIFAYFCHGIKKEPGAGCRNMDNEYSAGEKKAVPPEDSEKQLSKNPGKRLSEDPGKRLPDFADLLGQQALKRVSLIAAAGFHNLLIVGPPGAGKTMAVSRLPYILPPLTDEEQLEVTMIHSVAGNLKEGEPLITERVYRSPHHTVTGAALVGGGVIPKPGEATLAHKGVLFLDELTEFKRPVLELLRQPLEEHEIHLSRMGGSFVYPADFLLAAAMNPCPCGFYPDRNRCRCTEQEVARYRNKISGPLLDRIDLAVTAARVSYEVLAGKRSADGNAADTGSGYVSDTMTSDKMRSLVRRAWERQQIRYEKESYHYNGRIPGGDLTRWCPLNQEAERILKLSYEKLGLSARAYHRVLRVSRTIADLEETEVITESHVMEALGYRCFEQTAMK